MANHPALFPETTENDWRRMAGPAASESAVTDDGIALRPIYPRAVDAVPVVRSGAVRKWRIAQRLVSPDAESAAREAAEAIAGGADALDIVFDGSVHPLRSHLPVAGAARLAAAIAEIPAQSLVLRIDAGAATQDVAGLFGGTPSRVVIQQSDPIMGWAARTYSSAATLDRHLDLERAISPSASPIVVAIADGRLWHAAGASDVQELAAVVATLVAFLGTPGADPRRFAVALSAGVTLFSTMAKFRAMRLLLRRLGEILEEPTLETSIHAETAWRTITRIEPPMNVLRGTIATLAAIAGGADSVTVLTFDAALRPTSEGQRLARNTQLIAASEAALGRVADPAAGAGAIEALTAAIAQDAWREFQAIQAEGGILQAIATGMMFQDLLRRRRQRREAVAEGALPLIGVNLHAAANVHREGTASPGGVSLFDSLDAEYATVAPA